jgi:hypothetical protein
VDPTLDGSDLVSNQLPCYSPERELEEQQILDEEAECLKVRKWWCFLLSSIVTFFAGVSIVLICRIFQCICCRKEKNAGYSQQASAEEKAKAEHKAAMGGAVEIAPGGRAQQPEFEGTFMTEAKDWAGELISGQTTTGRILVSRDFIMRYLHST